MDVSPSEKGAGLRGFAGSVRLHLALVVLVGFLAYSNTFDAPFYFDDKGFLENPRVASLKNIPSFYTDITGPLGQRPLVLTSFAVNYALGGLDPAGYHAVNLALHLMNGLLLYAVVLVTGGLLGRPRGQTSWAGLFLSLVFVLHPLQTESVTYIVSRSVLFMTAFYLLGIILFVKAVDSRGARRALCIAALFAVSLLGAASREDFVTFPLMLVLYDLFFVSGFRARRVLGHWMLHAPVVASMSYLAFLVLSYDFYGAGAGFGIKGISPLEYLMTQFNVHWTYLRLLVFPVGQNLDYDYPVARSLFEFPTALSCAGYLLLWAGAVVLARRRPVMSFSMLWFLITITPASSIVPLADVIFEHRMYLPLAGAAGAVTATAALAYGRAGRGTRAALVALFVVVPIALAAASYARNQLWRSDVRMWEDVVSKSPNKARAHNNLGQAYYNRGLVDEAEEHLRAAVRLDPYYADAHYNLGLTYYGKKDYRRAAEHFEYALRIKPYFAQAHFDLGLAYRALGRSGKAERHFKLAASIVPHARAHFNLGLIYLDRRDTAAARAEFGKALSIRPGYVEARRFLRYASGAGRPPPH